MLFYPGSHILLCTVVETGQQYENEPHKKQTREKEQRVRQDTH